MVIVTIEQNVRLMHCLRQVRHAPMLQNWVRHKVDVPLRINLCCIVVVAYDMLCLHVLFVFLNSR